MRVIHKYTIPEGLVEWSTKMPAYAEILSVGRQGTASVLWASVETEQPMVARHFLVLPTGVGHDALTKACARFLGTVQTEDNGYFFVVHIFDRGEHLSAI